jgi:hypothetical protein
MPCLAGFAAKRMHCVWSEGKTGQNGSQNHKTEGFVTGISKVVSGLASSSNAS